ncbi:pre-mRNA-splicing factor CWC25 homolog [Nasonia vitripennis]|uniref:CBF1-interacting co-repressor CIR N-terminal domain-containing protein n=1 Tax=Nasonia vitripennis TaxID=7425 RepID=A0A7M7LJ19_NASVI|nr:pre-mRNA-splicing factor CWC25 homolog [Nasonia vitripennis]
MGGGDLNLKKSWHPSTMKNMEKVWKAEQEDKQEKKRIAELKREIAMERDREEMKAFAMEQGAIEKKEDKKLDWMYKGPHENVNREDYLLGRPIDKQFEQMAQAEKNTEQSQSAKNHVEHECIPPSLRFFSGNEQVDLARKLQEDPLYAIKKKEMETRAQLLKNPVKLKQLRQLLEQQTKDDKGQEKKKKKKRKKSASEDESDLDGKLDDILAAKYKKLKGRINEEDLIKSVKKRKEKKSKKAKKRKRKYSSKSDSSQDSDSDSSESESSSDEATKRKSKKKKQRDYEYNSDVKHKKKSHDDKNSDIEYKLKHFGLMKADGTKIHTTNKSYRSSEKNKSEKQTVKTEQKWLPPKKQKLTEEEKERRRQEMMSNASWRDKEREKNVKKYEEQEKKESIKEKSFDKDFAQKHLAMAADKETVASRIKSNINNIQRLKHSMDKNFARR